MLTTLLKRIALLLALPSLGLLYGCNDGGNSTSPAPDTTTAQTLSGTAATGMPIIAGNVMVVCASGSNLSTQTSVSGAWTVTLSGQTLPCAVQASGGTVNGVVNTSTFHSLALSLGTVNITPLTDLIVANLVGQAPGVWFNGLNGATLGQTATATAVNTALANLRNALVSVNGMSGLASINPITTSFSAVSGNPIDDMLEALQAALAGAGSNYPALLALASSGTGFTVTLTPTGGSGGSGSGGTGDPDPGPGSGGTGNYTLTLNVNAGGVVAPTVTILNVPKPDTQNEFCSELDDQTSEISLNNALGGVGSLTINSCSFNGTVGNVSATLSITSPVVMTVPYSVVYTYSN